jgi:hypothetical protein
MTEGLQTCPVCLKDASEANVFHLSCDHVLCAPCGKAASLAGHAACPLCRQPHMLDPATLEGRRDEFRSSYQQWRSGATHGAVGELTDIPLPTSAARHGALGLHSSSAGDLALLGELTMEGSQERPPSPYVPAPRLVGYAIVGMGRAGKIHLGVLGARSDAKVMWMVDCLPSACPAATVRLTPGHRTLTPALTCSLVPLLRMPSNSARLGMPSPPRSIAHAAPLHRPRRPAPSPSPPSLTPSSRVQSRAARRGCA